MLHAAAVLAEGDSTAGTVFGVGLVVVAVIVIVAALALFIAALVSILQSPNYTVAGRAVWFFVVLAFPFLGPLVWFVWGRSSSFGGDR